MKNKNSKDAKLAQKLYDEFLCRKRRCLFAHEWLLIQKYIFQIDIDSIYKELLSKPDAQ